MPDLDIRQAHALAARAISDGARRPSMARLEWLKAEGCSNPGLLEFTARSYPADRRTRMAAIGPGHGHAVLLDVEIPCRKCDGCMKRRSTLWWFRARNECRQAERNWFGTLTLSPDKHHLMLSRARARLIGKGTDFDKLDSVERFALHHAEISKEITLWLKRLRKQKDVRFRYVIVVEAHKSGLPHYHCLLHEVTTTPLRHAVLSNSWPHGFVHFKLVDDTDKTVSYVCKYLAKSALARVRASVSYGIDPLGDS